MDAPYNNMHRLSDRILFVSGGLIIVALVMTCVVVLMAYHRHIDAQAHRYLTLSDRLFDQLLDSHHRQLLADLSRLAGDSDLDTAINHADQRRLDTLPSGQTFGATDPAALVIGTDDTIIASDRAELSGLSVTLLDHAPTLDNTEAVASLAMIGEQYWQLVLKPAQPPPSLYIALGFPLDRALARGLQQRTGSDVSFWLHGPSGTPHLVSSSLPTMARRTLEQKLAEYPFADGITMLTLGYTDYLSLVKPPRSNRSRMRIILHLSWPEVLAPYHALQQQLLVLILFALLLSILIAAFLSTRMTRPVQTLVDAAHRIEAGHYSEPVRIHSGDEIGELAQAFNRMQQSIAERERLISHQARHDSLTDLPNRTAALQELDRQLAAAAQQQRPLALLLLDLSRFKAINDVFGQATADRILQAFARGLRAAWLHNTWSARLGGDEFLLLYPGADSTTASTLGTTLHDSLCRIVLDGSALKLDFNIGIAIHPEHGRTAETLLRRAGIALSDAKRHHDPVALYRTGRDEWYLRQLQLMGELPRAVARDELRLHYQPKLELRSDRITQIEALVRWQHPRYGLLQPGAFIPATEQFGNMPLISRWVLRHAVRQLGNWRRQGLDLAVAVNLSAIDLQDTRLPEKVFRVLQEHRIEPHRLIIEVTESTAMRDLELTLPLLQHLRQYGVLLSIDDFGTGHSSLAQLKHLPFDELKIDKCFIQTLEEPGDDALIVRTAIELAHGMRLSVVAEGVETDPVLRLLKQYRCDLIQGYHVSPPLPPELLTAWLRKRNVRSA